MTTVHTYPNKDLIEHDTESGDCVCGPKVEAVFREDGSNGWHVLHHSLDGRENTEGADHA
jgi:hypothetical protein